MTKIFIRLEKSDFHNRRSTTCREDNRLLLPARQDVFLFYMSCFAGNGYVSHPQVSEAQLAVMKISPFRHRIRNV